MVGQEYIALNYIIQAHQNPEQVARLVKTLNADWVYFYVHIDLKSDLVPFENALVEFSNVHLFQSNRVNVRWGDISQVEATLLSTKQILDDNRDGYCILLSGQDYPIKSNEQIQKFFKENECDNFINCRPIQEIWSDAISRIEDFNLNLTSKGRSMASLSHIFSKRFYSWTSLRSILKVIKSGRIKYLQLLFKKRKLPHQLEAFGGGQWWALPMDSIRLIHQFLINNPDYLKYHKYTLVPDEIFFQTILGSVLSKDSIKRSLTFIDWKDVERPLPVSFELRDFERLKKRRRHLFARKFAANDTILNKIDQELLK